MAGLLDFLNTQDAQVGLGLLAAAGPRSDGAGFGQRLLEGLSAGDAWKMRQAKMAQEAQAMEYQKMLMADHQQKLITEQRANELAARKAAALPTLFRQGSAGAPAMSMDSAMPPEMRTGMAPQAAVAPQQGGIDVQAALRAGYVPEEIQKLDALRNIGMNEVARTVKGMQNGREVEQQFDKFGRPVGQGLEQFRAPIEVATGDKKQFVDPYTLAPRASFAMGQSPDSKALNQVAWANNALANQRFAFDKSQGDKPQYIAELGGFANPRTQQVMPARDMQGNVIEGAGKMTEDQAKASGWLVQAQNAFKNMNSAMASTPSAAKPGIPDLVEGAGPFGMTAGIANSMRGTDRQKFIQGSSSLSEALLRAATGAGVNKEEAAQKIREITPVFGELAETTKQKMDAIPLYIESLKMRAGPGAKKASAIMGNAGSTGGSTGGWSIQKVD